MINMEPFCDIIHEWFEQRRIIEKHGQDELRVEDLVLARHQSLMTHLKTIIWQLNQQKKDIDILRDVLLTWVEADQVMLQRNVDRESREQALYNILEGYLNGQGYRTRYLPDLS